MDYCLKLFLKVSIICLITLSGDLYTIDKVMFGSIWHSMQQQYDELSKCLDKKGYRFLEKDYYHPHWMDCKNHVQALIFGRPNTEFLSDQVIGSTMVPRGMGPVQQYEISLIQDCASNSVRDLISLYKEPDIGPQPRECVQFDCSTNCLNKLSYAAKIVEMAQASEIIVEFGAGYGCLAHILRKILPDSTIILIDIPEFLALQYLYLRYAIPEETIIVHQDVPKEFGRGAIHLVPTHYINELQMDADIFISTFAISESPNCVQQIIIDNKFFHAKTCYIAGQLYGWNNMFEDHHLLLAGLRDCYSHVLCIPFYYTLNTVKSYELIAIN